MFFQYFRRLVVQCETKLKSLHTHTHTHILTSCPKFHGDDAAVMKLIWGQSWFIVCVLKLKSAGCKSPENQRRLDWRSRGLLRASLVFRMWQNVEQRVQTLRNRRRNRFVFRNNVDLQDSVGKIIWVSFRICSCKDHEEACEHEAGNIMRGFYIHVMFQKEPEVVFTPNSESGLSEQVNLLSCCQVKSSPLCGLFSSSPHTFHIFISLTSVSLSDSAMDENSRQ